VTLIEQVIVTENEEVAKSLWGEAVSSALVAEKQNSNDAECNYLVGYIFSQCPVKTEEVWQSGEGFLKRAIELRRSHQLARYHLACLYYDQGKYSEALSNFTAMSTEYFNEIGQPWRITKAAELRLSCCLYLNMISDVPHQAKMLFDQYKIFEDILLAPLPIAFAKCLDYVRERNDINELLLSELCEICYNIFVLLDASEMLAEHWPAIYRKIKSTRQP
jgi:hypothetical protein